MRIYQDGEQTVIDGEGHTTFQRTLPTSGMLFLGGPPLKNITVCNFNFLLLRNTPWKDIPTLLRWYFRRKPFDSW